MSGALQNGGLKNSVESFPLFSSRSPSSDISVKSLLSEGERRQERTQEISNRLKALSGSLWSKAAGLESFCPLRFRRFLAVLCGKRREGGAIPGMAAVTQQADSALTERRSGVFGCGGLANKAELALPRFRF